ncbi:hypothetical protein NL108_010232 [Boleophthalmus pectinirostris]|nr:hypothetical protein NL108_010232 [Boleophthalmus pectinirostris]
MYEVKIKTRSHSFKVYLCQTKSEFKRLTVKDLWEKIADQYDDYDSDRGRLYFRDSVLDEDDSLYELGIRNGSQIELYQEVKYGSSSSKTDSMDRLADFKSCVVQ